MMTRDEFFRALLAAAKEAGADEAEAYFAEDESFRALATKGVIENYAVNTAGGLSLRVRLSLTLVLAGGLGNLIDRALYGAVVDYIELTFMTFPVFNFADVCVTVGAALFALFTLLPGKREARA